MQNRKTTYHIMNQLGGFADEPSEVSSYRAHPCYQKFMEAGCNETVFKEIVTCGIITDYEELYNGFTKSLRRFRHSFDTLGLMLCVSKNVNAVKYGIENQHITSSLENCYGDSPLHLAALSGSASTVSCLINTLKIDPAKIETGIKANALHYAAMSNDIATLNYLIYATKISFDSKNMFGHNALDYACTAGALDSIACLYGLGLRPNLEKISHLIAAAPNSDSVWKKLEELGAIKAENDHEVEIEMDHKRRWCSIS